MTRNDLQILIVGAGPCGLSVAKALQNKGFSPDIIEKEKVIRADGAGIAIPANGTWALKKLKLDISEKAHLIKEMQFTDDQDEILASEKIDEIHFEKAQFYSMSRDELIRHIYSNLNPNTCIQTSTIIKNFWEEEDTVKVELSNGQIRCYDLVIGCDGIHSTLRSKIHPGEKPEFLNLLVWRTIVENNNTVCMPTYMLGADKLVLLYPLSNQRVYVYGHLYQSAKAICHDSFSQIFATFGGLVPDVLSSFNKHPSINNPFLVHHMEKSHSVRFTLDGFNRVLLVGDAAHAFGPMLQNGVAQAFEDAFVIQELLSNDTKKEDVVSFIENFKDRRLGRVQKVFDMSNIKIQAISDPKQIENRNESIRKLGAPNVTGFKMIMKQNP